MSTTTHVSPSPAFRCVSLTRRSSRRASSVWIGRCRRHRPVAAQEAFPHVHLLVVGFSDRGGSAPRGPPSAPADCGCHFLVTFLELAARASALARTTSGSRGSGGSTSSQGRSPRPLGLWMRIRFIADLRSEYRVRACSPGSGGCGLGLPDGCAGYCRSQLVAADQEERDRDASQADQAAGPERPLEAA